MITTTQKTINNQSVSLVDVETDYLKFKCMTLGASILDLQTKNKDGLFESVIMQFDSIEDYDRNDLRLNQIVGPTAGRYESGPYSLNKAPLTLSPNDGNAHLHGGDHGLSFQNFNVSVHGEDTIQIVFKTRVERPSFYPGRQDFIITYTLDKATLHMDFEADSTCDTFVNLTHHAYFNLSGNMASDILNHQVRIQADEHLRLNEDFIPVEKVSVDKTHLDFRQNSSLKDHLRQDIIDRPEKGIDNPLVLSGDKAIRYYDPRSHRRLRVVTDYPCVVVYSDNHNLGYNFNHIQKRKLHMGLCFETQLAPNGNNISGVKGSLLKEGDQYHYRTSFVFDLAEGLDD